MQNHLDPEEPEALKIRDRFFPGEPILRVPIFARGTSGQCYANALDYVAAHGGSIQLGWLITQRPKKYVEATHHAVWRAPDGTLGDVTDAAFPGMSNVASTFIEDRQTVPPTDYWHPVVPSWFLVLDRESLTKKYVRAVRTATERQGRILSLTKAAGFTMGRDQNGAVLLYGQLPSSGPIKDSYDSFVAAEQEKMRLQLLVES